MAAFTMSRRRILRSSADLPGDDEAVFGSNIDTLFFAVGKATD
jgi:hypothetical protein